MKRWAIAATFFIVATAGHADGIRIWAEEFTPYGYRDEKGEIVGLATEVVRFLVADSGVLVHSWSIGPWPRAIWEAQKNPNTLLYTVVRNPEREHQFYWIGPISDRNQYLYKLKRRKDIVVRSIEDAKLYVLGSVTGTAITTLLTAQGLEPYKVPDHEATVKMLLKEHLDLIVHLDYSLAHIAKNMGIEFSEFEPLLLVDSSKQYYIVLNKDSSPAIVEKLQTSFKKLVDTGGLHKIQQKYLR